jgi:hypothetical protein
VSNYSGAELKQLLTSIPLGAVQVPYHLFDRSVEREKNAAEAADFYLSDDAAARVRSSVVDAIPLDIVTPEDVRENAS